MNKQFKVVQESLQLLNESYWEGRDVVMNRVFGEMIRCKNSYALITKDSYYQGAKVYLKTDPDKSTYCLFNTIKENYQDLLNKSAEVILSKINSISDIKYTADQLKDPRKGLKLKLIEIYNDDPDNKEAFSLEYCFPIVTKNVIIYETVFDKDCNYIKLEIEKNE